MPTIDSSAIGRRGPVFDAFIGCRADHLKTPLEQYMAQYPKVKIVRGAKREGLIRARLLGLGHATAPTVTYLDSHCECTEGKSLPYFLAEFLSGFS